MHPSSVPQGDYLPRLREGAPGAARVNPSSRFLSEHSYTCQPLKWKDSPKLFSQSGVPPAPLRILQNPMQNPTSHCSGAPGIAPENRSSRRARSRQAFARHFFANYKTSKNKSENVLLRPAPMKAKPRTLRNPKGKLQTRPAPDSALQNRRQACLSAAKSARKS